MSMTRYEPNTYQTAAPSWQYSFSVMFSAQNILYWQYFVILFSSCGYFSPRLPFMACSPSHGPCVHAGGSGDLADLLLGNCMDPGRPCPLSEISNRPLQRSASELPL
jgi:hypothetical protein